MQKSTSGGVSDSADSEPIVMPWGTPSASTDATIATAVGTSRNAVRKRSGSSGIALLFAERQTGRAVVQQLLAIGAGERERA